MPSTVANPFTVWLEPAFSRILVPREDGLKVLRIQIGILFSIAGAIVLGCTTWRLGSALRTPSTSVQIVIARASRSFPKMEAEKSLPFRLRGLCPRPSCLTKFPTRKQPNSRFQSCDSVCLEGYSVKLFRLRFSPRDSRRALRRRDGTIFRKPPARRTALAPGLQPSNPLRATRRQPRSRSRQPMLRRNFP
jgi:hypothetical protein